MPSASPFHPLTPSQCQGYVDSEKDASNITDDDPSETQEFLPQYRLPKHPVPRYIALRIIQYILVIAVLVVGAGFIMAATTKYLFFNNNASPSGSIAPAPPFGMGTMSPAIMVSPCGSTASEAKTLGCHFDSIAFAWLPHPCYDEELAKSFHDTKFQFYLGPNNTDPISQDMAYTGEYPHLHVNWDYHLLHCTYMWRKMHRAVLGAGRGSVDGIARDYTHTEHCETMLLRRKEVGYMDVNTIVSVKYPNCGA